jgi:hypothetical protein
MKKMNLCSMQCFCDDGRQNTQVAFKRGQFAGRCVVRQNLGVVFDRSAFEISGNVGDGAFDEVDLVLD